MAPLANRITTCLMVLALAAAAGACKRSASGRSDAGITEDRVQKQGELHLGDDIVVESGKAMFIPGKVAKVEGATVGYMPGLGSTMIEAPLSSVYLVPSGQQAQEQVGDFVICRASGKFWKACRVVAVTGSVYVCEDDDGGKVNLSAADLILPGPATQTNIKERLERSARRREFLKDASESGKPQRPDGWKPKPGDAIVAPYISSWYPGTVTKVTGTTATIAWDDKSRPSERPWDELVPKPATGQKVRVGQFVLAAPGTTYTHRWGYARVEAIGSGAVTVVNEDEQKRTVRETEVIPIGR